MRFKPQAEQRALAAALRDAGRVAAAAASIECDATMPSSDSFPDRTRLGAKGETRKQEELEGGESSALWLYADSRGSKDESSVTRA